MKVDINTILKILLSFILIAVCSSRRIPTLPENIDYLTYYRPEVSDEILKSIMNVLETMKIYPDFYNVSETYIESCRNCTRELHETNATLLSYMYSYSGIYHFDLGDFKQCSDLNKEKLNAVFVLLFRYRQNSTILEKVSNGLCVPICCNELLNSLSELIFSLDSVSAISIQVFNIDDPNEQKSLFDKNIDKLIYGLIVIGYAVILIILNLVLCIFLRRKNPYDMQNSLALTSSSKKLSEEESDMDINPDLNTHFIPNTSYDVDELSKNQNSTRNLDTKQYQWSNIDNFYINLLRSRKNFSLINLYSDYFSILNNLYIFSAKFTPIYNESNLGFVCGFFSLFLMMHLVADTYNLLRLVSKFEVSEISLNLNYLLMFLLTTGRMYYENLMMFFGIILTYKSCFYYSKFYNNPSLKHLALFVFRNVDRLIIFIIVNIIVLTSLDVYMKYQENKGVLFYLWSSRVTDCTWENFIPFHEFFRLITGENLNPTCLPTNNVFFQFCFFFFLGLILIRLLHKFKYKLTVFLAILFTSLVFRILFAIYYIPKILPSNDVVSGDRFRIDVTHYILMLDYLHFQFFYNLPNVMIGMITGYILFLDFDIERINLEDLTVYYGNFNMIRKLLSNRHVRSILFVVFIIIFIIGGFSFRIVYSLTLDYNIPYSVALGCFSISGFLVSCTVCGLILTVKLKGEKMWVLFEVLSELIKTVISSNFLLVIQRASFMINMIHMPAIYFLCLFLIDRNIYIDFFSMIIVYGIPICFAILLFSSLLTIILEVPLRIFVRNMVKRMELY